MKIEICLMVYGYEKRFNWMLSSIEDCRKVSEHKIVVNVATISDTDRLDFSCMDLKTVFKNLKVCYMTRGQFQNRGLQRNQQVKKLDEDTDVILFADCDHLYEPLFFDAVIKRMVEVDKQTPDGETNMYTVRRTSTDDLDKLDRLISNYVYPSYIPNTIGLYDMNLHTRVTTAPGAGNTQFVFKKDLKE